MKKSRILIVEDESVIAELIQYSLQGMGYEVDSIVATGEEAIEAAKRGSVDLVLMDIILGSEMTGTTAAEKIKVNYNIPIVFLTAYLNESLLDKAKASEPFGYLLKPFNDKELYAAIEMALYKDELEKKRLRLVSLLRCSKNITQLVGKEKEIKKIFSGICGHFVNTYGIGSAWIILTDNENKIITWEEAGYGNKFQSILDQMQSKNPPLWCRKMYSMINNVTRFSRSDEETRSLYFEIIDKRETLLIRLEAQGKARGVIGLAINNKDLDREEMSILTGIASDIAFALSRKELESKNILIERKLIDSEKKYRQVAENAIDIIFTTNLEGYFTYVNKAGEAGSGYTLEELLRINYLNLILPEYKEKIRDFYREQFSKKINSTYTEYPYYTKGGDVKWFGQNATLLIENDQIKGFHCISRDITSQKKMEKELFESEKRYRQLVEYSPDGIVVFSSGKIVYANDAFIELFGATSIEQVDSLPLTELMLPDAIDVTRARIKASQETTTKVQIHEKKFRKLDGTIIFVEVTASPIIFHNEQAIQFVIRDVTSRKRVEEEFRRQQLEVNTLLDSMPGMTFFKDVNFKYIIVNQNFCEMLGYKKDEIVGKTDFDLLPRHLAEKYHEEDVKVIESGKELSLSEERTLIHGRYLTIGTRKVPLKDETGSVVGLIGLGVDVTEQKTAEEAIKRYSKEMEEINAEKDKFFSIISHDLRSPFQGLLGLSNAMIEEFDTLTLDETKLFINNIHNSAKNLFNLIENLLQWSRIQRGKLDFQPVIVDLYEETLYVINLLQRNAITKNIKLINKIEEDLKVKSDINILHSTLQNLVSNAIKFTPNGGEITIAAEKDVEYVSVSVIDTGVGIAENDIKKLFRIDAQHSTLGTEKESGTGLGLIICKELIERQGGNIWVESKIKKGTTFTITLPVAKD